MDDVTNVSTSNTNMYIFEGLNVLSGFRPDILQQALEEACEVDVPSTSSVVTSHNDEQSGQSLDMALSRLLQSPTTTSEVSIHNDNERLLDQLANISSDTPVGSLTAASKTVGVKNGLLSTQPNGGGGGLMTVFNGGDGTFSLSLEAARSLGINVDSSTTATATLIQVSKSSSNHTSSPVVFSNASVLPSSLPSGQVTYIIRPAQTTGWTPTSIMKPVTQTQLPVLQQTGVHPIRPAVNIVRPIMGGGLAVQMNSTSVLTNVLRPVMTTGIVKSSHTPRHQPILLPKLPSNSYTHPASSMSVKMLKPNPKQYIVTSSAANLAGQITITNSTMDSQQKPIHFIQEGSTLSVRSAQPLTNSQVTHLARVFKEKTQSDVNSLVCDNGSNSRVVYKIVYPEDVLPKGKRTAQSQDTSDEDSYGECESPPNLNGKVYTPEQLHNLPPPSKRGLAYSGRKRGRPRTEDGAANVLKAAEEHAKKLRFEFGLTGAQAQKLEKDIVDDRIVKMSSNRQMNSNEDAGDDNNADFVMSFSQTRSGRISRPPTQLDRDNLSFRHTSQPAQSHDVISVATVEEKSATTSEVKPKRKLSVPLRYRCRVCHKTYLGDRKMNRHVKLNPNHGPSEDPNQVSVLKEDANKKISALSTMPIIPLARTQLEDLVKNLDAELVLDVVSKKMFDNFSIWELQLKKMSISKEKGIKVIDRLFQDTEKVLSELKKLVDNCLTDTKLCDDPCPAVVMGEYLQLALSDHEGPWYLEKTNHIPEDYHKPLGLEPLIVSPRSDSNVTSVLLHPDDDNSNSMMSAASERDGCAQMVLKMEKNLGTRPRLEDMDDDTQDFGSPPKKFAMKAEDTLSPTSHDDEDEDEDEEQTSRRRKASTKSESLEGGELALEIDKLNKMQRHETSTVNMSHHKSSLDDLPHDETSPGDLFTRTRLPSFSSIIGNSDINVTTASNSDSSSLLSVLHSTSANDLGLNVTESHDHLCLHDHQHHVVSDHHHIAEHGNEQDRGDNTPGAVHSRRSSIDTGSLIIHESLPGSRHASPSVSRRTSIDHGSLLQHLNDRRSSVDQGLLSGSGLSLMAETHSSRCEDGLADLSSLSLPYMSDEVHDHSGCRMAGSDPPTPANSLDPLCGMMDPSAMTRHYHSMPNSPHPPQPLVTTASALASLTSFVGKARDDNMMSMSMKNNSMLDQMSMKNNSMLDQMTMKTNIATTTSVTFSDCHPIASLLPKKLDPTPLPDINKRPETPMVTIAVGCSMPHPHSGVSQDSSSSTSHFLSDLESVLGDSADFSFTNSLETPEKLFQSIPPMMAMHKKSAGNQIQSSSSSKVNAPPVRIDFLGALEEKTVLGTMNEKARSTYQETSNSLDVSTFSGSSQGPERDSLSRLFDEDPSRRHVMDENISNVNNQQQM